MLLHQPSQLLNIAKTMRCPDTPNTVIGELLRSEKGRLWEKSWSLFYDTYSVIMRVMAVNTLKRIGWVDFSETELEEIQTDAFISLKEAFENGNYKPENHRFRGFLKKVISRRVIDHIRSKNRKRMVNVEAIELVEALQPNSLESDNAFEELEENEIRVYRLSIVMDVWESIRHAYSPETCLAFEMTQLEGLSVKETCERLGVDRTKVDKAVFRITKKIREELEKDIYKKELLK